MNDTKYKVYYTIEVDRSFGIECNDHEYDILHTTTFGVEFTDLVKALDFTQELRNSGARFITMASENPDQVGKMGVDTIKNGILPDGLEYVYKTGRDRGRETR